MSFTVKQSESTALVVPVRVSHGAETIDRIVVVSGSLAVERTHVGGAG